MWYCNSDTVLYKKSGAASLEYWWSTTMRTLYIKEDICQHSLDHHYSFMILFFQFWCCLAGYLLKKWFSCLIIVYSVLSDPPSLTVPNLLPNEHELTIRVFLGNHSWSFPVILAMTMTINSNSVLLVRVTSAGRYESFEHVQSFCVSSANNFHSCLCALKKCSYHLCRTVYVLYSSHSHCMLVVLTVY